jgi:hypothetical protein
VETLTNRGKRSSTATGERPAGEFVGRRTPAWGGEAPHRAAVGGGERESETGGLPVGPERG